MSYEQAGTVWFDLYDTRSQNYFWNSPLLVYDDNSNSALLLANYNSSVLQQLESIAIFGPAR